MPNVKVVNIKNTGSFEYKQGVNAGKTGYGQRVEFSDGVWGNACSMTDQPPYKIGDEVVYEINGQDNRGNNKVKVKKADSPHAMGVSTNTAPQNPANQAQRTNGVGVATVIRGDTCGNIMKCATEAVTTAFLGNKHDILEAFNSGEYAKWVYKLGSQLIRVSQTWELGKLAPAKGESDAIKAGNAALESAGFASAKPIGAPPPDGSAYHNDTPTENVPF
jgi:hypothetical protein